MIIYDTTIIVNNSLCKLQYEPEIQSAFYLDLALRTFLSVRNILVQGSWPPKMKYLSCDEYDGTNSPDHVIDLKTAFIDVSIDRVTSIY